jgi:hypothetical protein
MLCSLSSSTCAHSLSIKVGPSHGNTWGVAPILRALRISGRKEIALATSISCSMYYIRYVPGPACRGSVPLYVPPLSYKRGGTQRYKAG